MVFFHSAVYFDLRTYIDRYEFNHKFNTLVPYDILLRKDGSIHEKRFEEFTKVIELFHKKIGGKLMLDSGAFSAYRSGMTIDVNKYIAFVKQYGDWFDEIVALDVIGDDAGTWENYKIMADAGIGNSIPVFHIREPQSSLDRLAEATEYIGFGQPSGLRGDDIIGTYHHFLYNQDGSVKYPKNKLHGFGIGSPIFFQVYPWYSCDASNASVIARYGSVPIIRNCNGHYEYLSVPVSSRQKKDPAHYSNLPESMMVELQKSLDEFGFSIEDFDDDSLEIPTDGLHNRMLFGIQVFDRAIGWLNKGTMKEFRPQPSMF